MTSPFLDALSTHDLKNVCRRFNALNDHRALHAGLAILERRLSVDLTRTFDPFQAFCTELERTAEGGAR